MCAGQIPPERASCEPSPASLLYCCSLFLKSRQHPSVLRRGSSDAPCFRRDSAMFPSNLTLPLPLSPSILESAFRPPGLTCTGHKTSSTSNSLQKNCTLRQSDPARDGNDKTAFRKAPLMTSFVPSSLDFGVAQWNRACSE